MEEAERRREGNRNPWIFRAICVWMSSLYLTATWSVFTWMCSPLLHSFGPKFIPLEGKASLERWGVKQRQSLSGSQEPRGTPARGRQPLLRPPGWSLSWLDKGEGTCFHCHVGHPWLLRRVWAQTRLWSCALEKAVPDSHECLSLAPLFRNGHWGSPSLRSESSVCPARGELAGQLAGALPIQIWACLLLWCHSIVFSPRTVFLGWGGAQGGCCILRSGWIQGCAPITRFKISDACAGPRPICPSWFPSPHSVTVFPPLNPALIKPSFASGQVLAIEIAFPVTTEFVLC